MEKILDFKFPAHRHLGFHDVTALSVLLKSWGSFVWNRTAQWRHGIQDGGAQEI